MKHPAAKARTVAKHAHHVKPAAAHHKKAATGHAQKHHKAAKHHAAAKKHKGTVAKRGLAIGAEVASCAAEALAASLRLSGLPVAPVDVLALYWHTAGDPDAGASISETLDAAAEFGLGGQRPAGYSPIIEFLDSGYPGAVILGVDLPGPHTVLATPEGWWSWGTLYCPWCDFPDAVVEEAWEVSWSVQGEQDDAQAQERETYGPRKVKKDRAGYVTKPLHDLILGGH